MNSPLSTKLVDIADRDNLPSDHVLRLKAIEFDNALETNRPKTILGAWARARRAFCEYTNTPLI